MIDSEVTSLNVINEPKEVMLIVGQVTMDGKVVIDFNQKLINPFSLQNKKGPLRILQKDDKGEFKPTNIKVSDMSEISTTIKSDEYKKDLNYYLDISEWNEDRMALQISFVQPLAVSTGEQKD